MHAQKQNVSVPKPCFNVEQKIRSMAIRIALHHKTRYQYDRLVNLSPHEVRLRPANSSYRTTTSKNWLVQRNDGKQVCADLCVEQS